MASPIGFDCGRCGNPLEREELQDGAATGNEKQTKLASQMDGFLRMLQHIDSEVIPSNDFETAFSLAVPVQRNEETNPSRTTVPLVVPNGLPTAVRGMTQITAIPLDVTVTTSSERTAAEKAAEAQRKAAIAAQNMLPEWHTKSTVTGESTVSVRKDSEQHTNGSILSKEAEEDQKEGNKSDEELTTYYAQIAEEREKERLAEAEADSDDDEEDFEDVGLGPSAAGTPSSSVSAEPANRLNGILKSSRSESGSSAPVTNNPTPSASFAEADEEDGLVAKRVKFESRENGAEVKAGLSVKEEKKDSDEDDEAEFEDAL